MEGLLPLIIALVISAIISANKKKKQISSQAPGPQEQSPWEDLVRELQKREDDVRPYSEPVGTPVLVPAPEESEPGRLPYFTYEEISGEEGISQETLSFEAPDPVAPAPRKKGAKGGKKAAAETRIQAQKSMPEPEDETSADELFAGGFDPRMAVIYSEIMRPKYTDMP